MSTDQSAQGVSTADPFLRDPLEAAIDAYLVDYSTEYDKTSYDPDDEERFRIKDAIMGLLSDPEWDRAWGEHIESLVSNRTANLVSERDALASRVRELEELFQVWSGDGSLQTFEDRERFRKAARAALTTTSGDSHG